MNTDHTENKWFTLRESHDQCRHIGTVGVDLFVDSAEAIKQFNEKIEEALTQHFDEPCKLVEPINPINYISTNPHDISFTFTFDGDEKPHEEQFEIEQTWLY